MIADGPYEGTINGVPFISEEVSTSITGASVGKATNKGTAMSQATPTCRLNIKAPDFGNADPVQIARVTERMSRLPALIILTSLNSGATDTTYGTFEGMTRTRSASGGSEITYSYIIGEPLQA